jgi:hypothetical protein
VEIEESCGQPYAKRMDDDVERIQELIQQNMHLSIYNLCKKLISLTEAVMFCMKDLLCFICYCLLIDEQKEIWLFVSWFSTGIQRWAWVFRYSWETNITSLIGGTTSIEDLPSVIKCEEHIHQLWWRCASQIHAPSLNCQVVVLTRAVASTEQLPIAEVP